MNPAALGRRRPLKKNALIGGLVVLSLLLGSCSRARYALEPSVQTGTASWYGPDFHGKLTSNKEIFNTHDMTAAHKTLPFGSWVMVTNLENGLSVIVRINDRGPFIEGRIIDLSYAAAKVLGMVGPGTARVRLEVLKIPEGGSRRSPAVQVGSFVSRSNAAALRDRLRTKYPDVAISPFTTPAQTYYRVRIKAADRTEAGKIARALDADGYSVIILDEP